MRFHQLLGRAVAQVFPKARYYKQNEHIIYILSLTEEERSEIACGAGGWVSKFGMVRKTGVGELAIFSYKG